MSSSKKIRTAPLSRSSFRLKFLLLDIIFILALVTSWYIMINTIDKASSEKYDQLEKTAVTATEQMTNNGVDSAISIAKNIYTNEPVYNFLNTRYASSAEYFEAYYPLFKNTALSTADTNIVKKCTIYTSNPTILSGGTMASLDSVKNEEWYKSMKEFNKTTILNIDHKDQSMNIIRKLDYIQLETGESYLYLKLSSDFIRNFVESLDFDGCIYIMSGSDLLYSSDKDIRSISDITITPEFECIKRNYYTVDIEFYSYANKKGIASILRKDHLVIYLIIIVVLFNIFIIAMVWSILSRIRPVLKEFKSESGVRSLIKGNNGRDEIGKLLDICSEMSERLTQKGSEFKESSDSLMKKSSDYNSLFTTALKLDAELSVLNKMPYLYKAFDNDCISLADESEMIGKAAEKLGKKYSFTGNNKEMIIPAYSLLLITDDMFNEFDSESVKINASDEEAVITFKGGRKPRSVDSLKLLAVFEDENVSSEYSFANNYRFNPYIRIRHCLGRNIDMDINAENGMRITFTIYCKQEKGE